MLDITKVKGKQWLDPGEPVFTEDLEAAEAAQGVRVEEGDALMLRLGWYKRRLELGPPEAGRPGLHAETIPWLHERGVSILAGDASQDMDPAGYPNLGLPVQPGWHCRHGSVAHRRRQLRGIGQGLRAAKPVRLHVRRGAPSVQERHRVSRKSPCGVLGGSYAKHRLPGPGPGLPRTGLRICNPVSGDGPPKPERAGKTGTVGYWSRTGRTTRSRTTLTRNCAGGAPSTRPASGPCGCRKPTGADRLDWFEPSELGTVWTILWELKTTGMRSYTQWLTFQLTGKRRTYHQLVAPVLQHFGQAAAPPPASGEPEVAHTRGVEPPRTEDTTDPAPPEQDTPARPETPETPRSPRPRVRRRRRE